MCQKTKIIKQNLSQLSKQSGQCRLRVSDQPGKALLEPGSSSPVVIGPCEQEALTLDVGAITHVGHTVYAETHGLFTDLLGQDKLHRNVISQLLHSCKGSMVIK